MLTRRASILIQRAYAQYVVNSPYGDVSVPSITLDQYIFQNMSKWENKTALECGVTGRQMTYKELRFRSNCLASNLTYLGLSGGTALLVLPNCLEYPLALLGSLLAGVTVSPANPIYTSGELKHQAVDSGAKVVITEPGCMDRVLAANIGLPVICTGDAKWDGVHSFQQMTESSSGKSVPIAESRMKQLAYLPYSSGTTGLPKGVRLTHRNIIANLEQITQPKVCPIRQTEGEYQDTIPAVLPFFHIYGSVVVLLRSIALGAKIITLPKFEPNTFLQIIRKNKDIVLYAVPPIISYLGGRPEVKSEDLEGIRYTLTGAAPCSKTDLIKLKEKKPHHVCQAYGMTEASPVLTHPQLSCDDEQTVGPPVAGTLGQIIDPNDGKPLPPGMHGELCFKGPQVMEGYHNRPEATSETVDGQGWLHTGDIGYFNTEGKFYIVDRLKELIKVKGFQVAPAELEGLLRQHPTVLDAGVTSVPSLKSGELPVAFLVPKPGQTIEEDKVSKWVADQVAPYKKLAKILTVKEIPRSQAGKILRRMLKEIAYNEVKLD